MPMTSSRSWLLTAAGMACAATLAAPAAQAAEINAATAAPLSAHQGLAFTPTFGAKARIVEPDGRVLKTDGASDLVSPSSITERRVRTAIAELVRTAVPATRKAAAVMPPPTLQAP
jgi:hypothetical protein